MTIEGHSICNLAALVAEGKQHGRRRETIYDQLFRGESCSKRICELQMHTTSPAELYLDI